jgi:hypothetical protein
VLWEDFRSWKRASGLIALSESAASRSEATGPAGSWPPEAKQVVVESTILTKSPMSLLGKYIPEPGSIGEEAALPPLEGSAMKEGGLRLGRGH